MVKKKIKTGISNGYLFFMLLMLYVPIGVLIISSFNASPRNKAKWGGFSLKGYRDLLGNDTMMQALGTTLLLAFGAALVATVLGTLVCIGMMGMKKSSRTFIMGITNIPLLNADIVTGIALMLLFSRFLELSFWTMLIAHVTLIIPYVVLSVQPKVAQLNVSTYEAALDLGASPLYAFYKVVLPELLPGILSGFLLSFTMSLDDFSVTYFTKAPGIHTMSTMINAEYRKGIQTEIYALSTIVFLVVLIVLFLINHRDSRMKKKWQAVKGRTDTAPKGNAQGRRQP
jgi:spermidine/putrescine transport system permease protein